MIVPVTLAVGMDTVPEKVGDVNVLFVNVSVPARVANVPFAPGRVIVVVPAVAGANKVAVPEVEPLKPTLILFDNVSDPANVAKVPVAPGRVIVVVTPVPGAAKVAVPEVDPLKPILEVFVNALFCNVSAPPNVAKVPVAPGSVIVVVPAVAGANKVAVPEVEPLKPTLILFDNVSAPAKVAKVPELGKVTFVVPVDVKVVANSPEVDRFPANVIVLAPLFIPVPPYVPPIKVPFQVPVPIVPTVVITLEPAAGEAPTVL